MSLFSIFLSLFLVMNVIGNTPVFIALLADYDLPRQRMIILREMLIALGILVLFNFFGDHILNLLGISKHVIGISGGALLFIIALGMIFPKSKKDKMPHHEPFIVPLAMPIVAGPGAITSVMVYAGLKDPMTLLIPICFAWILSLVIVLAASYIKRFLGEKGLTACERLGGMLISLIAVQMLSSGIINLVIEKFPPSVQ